MTTDRPASNRPNLSPQPEGKSKDIGGVNMKVLIVMLAIALGASYLMNTFTSVSIKKYNSNGIVVGNAITAIQKSQGTDESNITAMQTSIANALTTIKTATDSFNADKSNYQTLQSQVNGLASNSVITGLQASLNNDESQLNSLSTSLTALQTALGNINVSATQADVATLKSSLTADEATIKALQAELKVDEAQMTTQEAQIVALQGTTTTTTTTGTTTASGLTAIVPATLLGSPQSVQFAPLPNGTTTPNTENGTFTFTLNNSTNATANNIQLGIILQVIQGASTSNPTALDLTDSKYAAVVTVNLNGFITTWSSQVTGQTGVLAFVNNIPSGILAGLGGTLSQVVGT